MMIAGEKNMVVTQEQGSCDEFINSMMFEWWIHDESLI